MTRPPVSLSMALGCRMRLWLSGHGYENEPVTPTAQRTFDIGHLAEAAMFDGITVGTETHGPWWPSLGEIRDNDRGVTLNPLEWDVIDRQREVSLGGYNGHIDGLLKHKTDGTIILPDMKTASSFGYEKSLKGDLSDPSSPFSRGYVGQLHAYRLGLIADGVDVSAMILLYFSKEQSKVSFRHIDHNPEIDAEILERLSWAKSPMEPTPDYEWKAREPVPLACGYCSQRTNCASIRGFSLEMEFSKRGAPVWRAA